MSQLTLLRDTQSLKRISYGKRLGIYNTKQLTERKIKTSIKYKQPTQFRSENENTFFNIKLILEYSFGVLIHSFLFINHYYYLIIILILRPSGIPIIS